MKMLFSLSLLICLAACSEPQTTPPTHQEPSKPITEPTNKVTLASEVEWTPLNPARGDQSPQAGTLWGDRSAEVATGFLVKFKDGFSSPPHIHNVTYRGVVISGLIHNDDPEAAKMWMPAGSFWTQPAGEAHITAAQGEENMAFIEIQDGPYLVKPTDQAYDNGERPLNLDQSNVVWVDLPNSDAATSAAKVSYLWGDPQSGEAYGALLMLPSGFSGQLHTQAPTFKAVVIQGQLQYELPQDQSVQQLEPGSYFNSEGKAIHTLSVASGRETMLYLHTNEGFETIAP